MIAARILLQRSHIGVDCLHDGGVANGVTVRILDLLEHVKGYKDGTLSFRRSCAHGVCGSDAMRINGRNRLACKTLIKDLDITQPIYVEPIKGLAVEKDLVVDMNPFSGW